MLPASPLSLLVSCDYSETARAWEETVSVDRICYLIRLDQLFDLGLGIYLHIFVNVVVVTFFLIILAILELPRVRVIFLNVLGRNRHIFCVDVDLCTRYSQQERPFIAH